jgi:purine nucleoside phosphorylase
MTTINSSAAVTPRPIAKISLLSVIILALETGLDVAGKCTVTNAILSRTGTPLSFTEVIVFYITVT